MTSFSTQVLTTPMVAPLISSEKGTMGNRIDCSVDQTKNSVVTLAKVAVPAAVIGTTAWGINKYGGTTTGTKFMSGMDKLLNSAVSHLKKVSKNGSFQNAMEKIGTLSPKAKILGLLTAIAAPAVAYVGAKHLYTMGQIDQKYTDRAQTQQIVKA